MIKAMGDEVPGASTGFKLTANPYERFASNAGGNIVELFPMSQRLEQGVIRTEGYKARRDQFSEWRLKQTGNDNGLEETEDNLSQAS